MHMKKFQQDMYMYKASCLEALQTSTLYMHMYMCMYMHMCMRMHMHMYMHLYMYMYMHMYGTSCLDSTDFYLKIMMQPCSEGVARG